MLLVLSRSENKVTKKGKKQKIKQSHNTPMEAQEGEDV
jgi:hypothetical protein